MEKSGSDSSAGVHVENMQRDGYTIIEDFLDAGTLPKSAPVWFRIWASIAAATASKALRRSASILWWAAAAYSSGWPRTSASFP